MENSPSPWKRGRQHFENWHEHACLETFGSAKMKGRQMYNYLFDRTNFNVHCLEKNDEFS